MLRRLIQWPKQATRFVMERPVRLVSVGGAFLLGGLIGLPVQQRAFDYTWRNADFCDDCHVHDYANEAWARSQHAGLTTCHDCHLVPIRHYPRNLWVTALDTPQGPEDIHRPHVATVICTRCHSHEADDEPLTGPMPEAIRQRVVKIDDSPLHRVHMSSETRLPKAEAGGGDVEPAADPPAHLGPHEPNQASWDAGVISCADCHGAGPNRAHRFEATRENCLDCHENLEAHGDRLVGTDCRACHFPGFIGEPGDATASSSP